MNGRSYKDLLPPSVIKGLFEVKTSFNKLPNYTINFNSNNNLNNAVLELLKSFLFVEIKLI